LVTDGDTASASAAKHPSQLDALNDEQLKNRVGSKRCMRLRAAGDASRGVVYSTGTW
jgi:hypothetical protein